MEDIIPVVTTRFTHFADCTGLEPVNSTVTGWHDNQLHQQSIEPKDGFEPLAYSLEVNCSIQLSYRTIADWTGLEPVTSAVTGRHSNQLNYQSF